MVLTANGEVHTHEEAQVFVHDQNLFVTVQLLEEKIAVLSIGKLCEDHGYSYEFVSGQKLRLTKGRKTIIRKTDNFVPLVVPLEALRPPHRHRKTRQVHLQVQYQTEVTKQLHEVGTVQP